MNVDILKQVILEHQDEIRVFHNASLIRRDQFESARKQISKKWIKVIMGVRRCGKSSFAHQLLEDTPYGYVNFDDERLTGMKAADLDPLLQTLLELNLETKTFLFDEIQNVDGWELFANRLHRKGYNLVITGSNSKLLSKELATHLTGRHVQIDLHPFSFREFLRGKGVEWNTNDFHKTQMRAVFLQNIEQYFKFGGFPEMVVDGYDAHYLRNLYDKIITKDITDRYHIKYSKTLKEIALYGFSNLGNRLSFQKVKNAFDLNSVHTVKNYLQYLEDAYLIFLIHSFSYKVREQIKSPRKLYTIDNGISHAISIKFTSDNGAALENLVFQELKRRGLEFFYWSTPEAEVDFAIKSEREVEELIQVCYSLHDFDTKKREVKALIKASEATKCKKLRILTWNERGEEKSGKLSIQIQPVWEWLLS